MTPASERQNTLTGIDEETLWLVRIAAAIAGSDESTTRTVMDAAVNRADHSKVDEVILQSYLFAGFPRTLNAARTWRAVSESTPPAEDPDADLSRSASWTARGEETCKVIYGESYEMLRRNIRGLHPALDTWMITDGYGKVLSRPGLDLKTRELCIVAACAASGQQRQLHSHLHGALNAGATLNEVEGALSALSSLVQEADLERYEALLSRVASRRHPPRKQSS